MFWISLALASVEPLSGPAPQMPEEVWPGAFELSCPVVLELRRNGTVRGLTFFASCPYAFQEVIKTATQDWIFDLGPTIVETEFFFVQSETPDLEGASPYRSTRQVPPAAVPVHTPGPNMPPAVGYLWPPIEASCVLDWLVDTQGQVEDIRIGACAPAWAVQALEAGWKWRFEPAEEQRTFRGRFTFRVNDGTPSDPVPSESDEILVVVDIPLLGLAIELDGESEPDGPPRVSQEEMTVIERRRRGVRLNPEDYDWLSTSFGYNPVILRCEADLWVDAQGRVTQARPVRCPPLLWEDLEPFFLKTRYEPHSTGEVVVTYRLRVAIQNLSSNRIPQPVEQRDDGPPSVREER